MNKNNTSAKWMQLETMLQETPEKVKAPNTAKASSRNANVRLFRFVRDPNGTENPYRSLNGLSSFTPDSSKSKKKFFAAGSKNDTEDSKGSLNNLPVGSLNNVENDTEFDSIVPSKPATSIGSNLQGHRKSDAFIIRKNQKRYSVNSDHGSLNQLEALYKISEAICGMGEGLFRTLFRKKCEVCIEILSLIITCKGYGYYSWR